MPPSDTSWETQGGPSLSELLGAERWGGWSPGHQAPGAVPGADLRPRLLLSQPGSPPPGRPTLGPGQSFRPVQASDLIQFPFTTITSLCNTRHLSSLPGTMSYSVENKEVE